MNFAWLKHIVPRGLYGRAALILIVPIVTIQLVVSVVFIQRHFERVTRQMTQSMLREIVLVIDRADGAPSADAAQAALIELAAPLGLDVVFVIPAVAPVADQRPLSDLTGIVVIDTIRSEIPQLTAIDLSDGAKVRLYVPVRWGMLRISFSRGTVSASNPHQLLVLMLAVSVLMTVIAFLFLRNQLRPIRRLARAAEAFGKGQAMPYKPSGAIEVRAAGSAFLEMRARLERQIEQRTLMLSGISHDLRTPLTRLRLGLSMLPDTPDTHEEIAAMERDVAEMGKLVDAFLAFAREEATSGDAARLDPCAFVAQVVEDARRTGAEVTLHECPGPGQAMLTFRPDAMRRALDNLIGNATRYGSHAEVSVFLTPKALRIVVEDDGPGIAPERREEALRPFARLDPARNQDRGQGVGLGLSIAADILRSHGGVLRLGESTRLGGLWAELALPR